MRIELEQPEDQKKKTESDSFMPPKDERRTFKTEIAKMKEMGFQAGWNYFWDYYKYWVIGIVAGIIFIASMAHSVIQNRRPVVIEIQLFNNAAESDETVSAFNEAFAAHMGTDLKKSQMTFSYSDLFDPDNPSEQMQASFYKFAAMTAAQELDIIGGNRAFVDYYGYTTEDNSYFADLKELLPEDLFSQLEAAGKLYYCKRLDENGAAIREYAAGINIDGSRLVNDAKLLVVPSYIGIIQNTQRLDTAIEFIRWIFYLD